MLTNRGEEYLIIPSCHLDLILASCGQPEIIVRGHRGIYLGVDLTRLNRAKSGKNYSIEVKNT